MSFNDFVYRIGKRYGKERDLNPDIEFPYFSGSVIDLLDPVTYARMPELQGEYVIAYNGQGVQHFIRVYIECGVFEAEGTATPSNSGFSISSHVDQ